MNFTTINAIILSESASMAPRRMTIREGCDLIAATVDEANPGSSLLKHRLMYHIRGNDMDACNINASIEFLQFGLMPEDKYSGATPGFVKNTHLREALETRGLDYKEVAMKTHVGLFHSARLTEYTQQLSAGEDVEPIPTRYGVDDAPGKSRTRGMIFVSPRALLQFINFNGVLGEYCILMMKMDSWITQGYINGLNSQRDLDAATIMSQRSTIVRQSTDAADTLSLLARIEAGMRQNRDEFTVQLKSVRSDLGEKIEEANERFQEVNEKLDEANEKLDEAAVEQARMLSTIGNIAEMLVEKSLTSTMNPADPDLVHHYAIIARPIQIKNTEICC